MIVFIDGKVNPGDRFGQWTILGQAFSVQLTRTCHVHVVAQCDCGEVSVVSRSSLMRGGTKSCRPCVGLRNGKHLANKTRLYARWCSMKYRCLVPTSHLYRLYGGRGISVCAEWMEFGPFRDWALANGYSASLTLDRIDSNGNYCPDNCRWATMKEQTRNKRTNRHIKAFGETKLMCDWLEDPRCRVACSTLIDRLARGLSPEAAISTPPYKGTPNDKASLVRSVSPGAN